MRIDSALVCNESAERQDQASEGLELRNRTLIASGTDPHQGSGNPPDAPDYQSLDQIIRTYQIASQNIAAGISALQILNGDDSVVWKRVRQRNRVDAKAAEPALRSNSGSDWSGKSRTSDESRKHHGNRNGDFASEQETLTLSALGMAVAGIESNDAVQRALSALDQDLRAELNNQSRNDSPTAIAPALSCIMDLDFAQALTDKMRVRLEKESRPTTGTGLSGAQLLAVLDG